jgi:hypothetical protein
MHIWLDLIFRELFFVALLTALGLGPAAFLPRRFDLAARLALAPALGLSVGVCFAVTLAYPFPARDTGWVVIALAVASLAVAAWRTPLQPHWPNIRGVAQIAIVAIVILVSFDVPLAIRHTVGPDGGYQIADTTGYVSETNGIERESIHQAERARAPFADLALAYWSGYARRDQQLDLSALEANVNEVLGLGSTDTQSPFLIAVLLVGALGVFAVVRIASGRPTWGAVLAGCLFAGPLFAELFMDGSQGAITGCALLPAAVAIGFEALARRQPATLALFALLAAGLQTVYPLFLPALVLGGGAAIAVMLARRLRRGLPTRRELAVASGQLLVVIALAAAFTPVAFLRNARYWSGLLTGSFSLAGLPAYVLPGNILPGWVLQTREFYNLPDLRHATPEHLLLGALLPALLIGVIAFGVVRRRAALALVAVAAGGAVLAYYTWANRNCGYCVQRNLIPVGALAPAALGIGVAALAALRVRAGVWLAVAVAAVTIVVVGHEAIVERQRLANGSYLVDSQDRQALATLPPSAGPVELEGFGQGPLPPMELPLVYNLVDEKTHGNLSIPTDTDDGRGLLYLGGVQPLGPSFKSNYQYVLTRLASIRTQRRVLARNGPIALQQRTHDLDVTITGGVSVAAARFDPTGTAWVSNVLRFLVVGGRTGPPAWVSLELQRTVPVKVLTGPGVSAVRQRGNTLRICLRALGAPPVRSTRVQLAFTSQPVPPPHERYADPLPAHGVRLVSMAVSARSCAQHQ